MIDVNGYDTVTAVDCGGNLTRTGCPSCGAAIGHYRACSRRAPRIRKGPYDRSRTGPFRDLPGQDQALILVTWPAPTVRPPSRMANFRPSSMATGWMSSTFISVLSPGMTISVPSGRVTTPVTSVVRK